MIPRLYSPPLKAHTLEEVCEIISQRSDQKQQSKDGKGRFLLHFFSMCHVQQIAVIVLGDITLPIFRLRAYAVRTTVVNGRYSEGKSCEHHRTETITITFAASFLIRQ